MSREVCKYDYIIFLLLFVILLFFLFIMTAQFTLLLMLKVLGVNFFLCNFLSLDQNHKVTMDAIRFNS